jgi:hypothetical protein
LNNQGFTHWIFPKITVSLLHLEWDVDIVGIFEFPYPNPLWLGMKTEFVLYVGCIKI